MQSRENLSENHSNYQIVAVISVLMRARCDAEQNNGIIGLQQTNRKA